MLKKHYSLTNIKETRHSSHHIFNRLSEDEYSIHLELNQLNSKKKPRYDFLSKEESKPILTKNITDEKKYNFIQNLNAFRNHYYVYSKEEEKELRDYNKVHKENNEFTHKYRKVFKNNNNDKPSAGPIKGLTKCFNDIQVIYQKKKYKIPQMNVEHNIFKENPLILGNADLYKYYFFQRGNPQTEKNSYNYLNKLNDQVFSKATAKKQIEILSEVKDSSEKAKYDNLLLQDIQKNKHEINKTTKTLEDIDDFDSFFITKENFNINFNCNKNDNKDKDSEILVIEDKKESTTNHLPEIQIRKQTPQKMIYNNSFTKSNNHNNLLVLDKPESKKKRAISNSRALLENLYEDTKHSELKNTPSPAIKEYFNAKTLLMHNDHSTKGIYRQLQIIKDKFLRQDLLNNHLNLKGIKQGTNEKTSEEDLIKIRKTRKLESRLLLNEKLFVKIAFHNKKP